MVTKFTPGSKKYGEVLQVGFSVNAYLCKDATF